MSHEMRCSVGRHGMRAGLLLFCNLSHPFVDQRAILEHIYPQGISADSFSTDPHCLLRISTSPGNHSKKQASIRVGMPASVAKVISNYDTKVIIILRMMMLIVKMYQIQDRVN